MYNVINTMQHFRIKHAVLLLWVLFFGAIVFTTLDEHFPEGDEIIFINSIIEAQEKPYFTTRIFDKQSTTYHRPYKVALRQWREQYPSIFDFIDTLSPFLVIGLSHSSAPLSYVVAFPFISTENSYRENLFWGRFPSFLSFVLGLWIWGLFFIKKFGNLPVVLLGVTLMGYSLQN